MLILFMLTLPAIAGAIRDISAPRLVLREFYYEDNFIYQLIEPTRNKHLIATWSVEVVGPKKEVILCYNSGVQVYEPKEKAIRFPIDQWVGDECAVHLSPNTCYSLHAAWEYFLPSGQIGREWGSIPMCIKEGVN